jgi:hypothetical protein
VLIVLAMVGVVVLTAVYWQEVWADSGSFAVVLFGIPVVCTVLALVAERASRKLTASAVVAVLGVVCLAWSLLTAGGLGYGFVPSSLLLMVAATVSSVDRQGRNSVDQVPTYPEIRQRGDQGPSRSGVSHRPSDPLRREPLHRTGSRCVHPGRINMWPGVSAGVRSPPPVLQCPAVRLADRVPVASVRRQKWRSRLSRYLISSIHISCPFAATHFILVVPHELQYSTRPPR